MLNLSGEKTHTERIVGFLGTVRIKGDYVLSVIKRFMKELSSNKSLWVFLVTTKHGANVGDLVG